jgi:hypothetical protein
MIALPRDLALLGVLRRLRQQGGTGRVGSLVAHSLGPSRSDSEDGLPSWGAAGLPQWSLGVGGSWLRRSRLLRSSAGANRVRGPKGALVGAAPVGRAARRRQSHGAAGDRRCGRGWERGERRIRMVRVEGGGATAGSFLPVLWASRIKWASQLGSCRSPVSGSVYRRTVRSIY